MNNLPLINLERKYHRKEHQILIDFKYNASLISILRDIPKAKWSKSLKTWYIKNTPENLKLIFKLFKGEANINADAIFNKSIPMHQYPKKRIRNLTTTNRSLLNNFYKYLKGKRYSAQSVRQFLSKNCKKARIYRKVTPHTLRHSYATHLLENGVDIRYIQTLLGHSKPETTMIYTHVQRKDLMSISNPLDVAIQKLNNTNKTIKKLSYPEK